MPHTALPCGSGSATMAALGSPAVVTGTAVAVGVKVGVAVWVGVGVLVGLGVDVAVGTAVVTGAASWLIDGTAVGPVGTEPAEPQPVASIKPARKITIDLPQSSHRFCMP